MNLLRRLPIVRKAFEDLAGRQLHLLEAIETRGALFSEDPTPNKIFFEDANIDELKLGPKILPEIANYALIHFPNAVWYLYERCDLWLLCVDENSFDKLTFYLSTKPDAMAASSAAWKIFYVAALICPEHAEEKFDFYRQFLTLRDIIAILPFIRIPDNIALIQDDILLSYHVRIAKILMSVLREKLPWRFWVLKENRPIYDRIKKEWNKHSIVGIPI